MFSSRRVNRPGPWRSVSSCGPTPATSATSRPASTGSAKFKHEGRVLIRRLFYVAFFLEVGLLLIVMPWSGFWEQNYFAGSWPWLRSAVTNNFVRGGISGLGIVNLVAGFADLMWVFTARERTRLTFRDGTDR